MSYTEAQEQAKVAHTAALAKDCEEMDTVDGFRKAIKKRLLKLVGGAGNIKKSELSESDKDFIDFKALKTPQKPDSYWDEDAYDFNNKRRGLAIIINNEDFSQSREFGNRGGSSYDASALNQTFKRLGFDVLHFDDLQSWKMLEVLRTAALQYDHSHADCFVCSILTHGEESWTKEEYECSGARARYDNLFGVDGKHITTKSVVELFSNDFCPKLKDKPRLFFFQACRGVKYDHGQKIPVTKSLKTSGIDSRSPDKTDGLDEVDGNVESKDAKPLVQRAESFSSSVDPPEFQKHDTVDAKGENTTDENSQFDSPDSRSKSELIVSPAPLYQDFLIMYATPPGYYAWRRKTGAWFVQSLCKLLSSDSCRDMPLSTILTRVSGIVATEYESKNPSTPKIHRKKEIPVIESMLIKEIYMSKRNRQ